MPVLISLVYLNMFLTKKTMKKSSPLKLLGFITKQIGHLSVNLFFLIVSTPDEKNKINYSDHFHQALWQIVIKIAYIGDIHYYYSQPMYMQCQVLRMKTSFNTHAYWKLLVKM